MEFKIGSKYTRDQIHTLYFGTPYPRTGSGNWTSGYVRVENELIIFMNINVPGTTGHDFPNKYNADENRIEWFGKPDTHSGQPTFVKLFNGEYEGHFFARWHTSDLSFTYLGKGKNYRFEDGHPTFRRNGTETTTVKVFLSCENSREILSNESEQNDLSSTFALEKHLEDFLVQNWNQTQLSQKYDLLFEDDKFIGQQYATDTGFIDLLAISKDKNELLVIELKKGRASNSVLGQIQRYMGYILEEIAEEGQTVRGLIIALEDDKKLRRALVVTNNIEFFRYKVSFELFQN